MRVTASHSIRELFTTRAPRVLILASAIFGLSACIEGGGSETATSGSTGSTVTLSWNASSGEVIGYKVFYGTSPAMFIQEVSDLHIDSKEVDATAPAVTYDTVADLSHQSGATGCFWVKAYNYSGESGYSEPVCATL